MAPRPCHRFERILLVVLDSVGVGGAPDAAAFGDEGANTLLHTLEHFTGSLALPTLQRLGLGNIDAYPGVPPAREPLGQYGALVEISAGKDTTTGHWELAGLTLESPFPTYPTGFPDAVLAELQARMGRRWLGNVPASGTEILERLGARHAETGWPIVYTSADSVFQVAAHVDVVPLEELYRICAIAREILRGPHAVARVIARPFAGVPGAYVRLAGARHDYSLPPPQPTVLDSLRADGVTVTAVGKISDIFAGTGIDESHHTGSNDEGMDVLERLVATDSTGLVFVNLVDFDSAYGHRRDPRGYGLALAELDRRLGELLPKLSATDLLILTADHGNDPTFRGTDHTRERVPVLLYGRGLAGGVDLGVRRGFGWVAGTIAALFSLRWPGQPGSLVP
ncbi:MAG: phosphopentomutase [Candidatus Schekmanbacteria bacterium]|nr:phosphopentomutase [Candidatus Schekmanbacteria bacterium]